MVEGRLPKIALKWMPKQKRARGRPKKNWMEDIRKAMNESNLNEGQWEDRKQWSLGVGQRRKTFWILYIYIMTSATKIQLAAVLCTVVSTGLWCCVPGFNSLLFCYGFYSLFTRDSHWWHDTCPTSTFNHFIQYADSQYTWSVFKSRSHRTYTIASSSTD